MGFSVYYRRDARLRHLFYLKEDDGTFKIVPELNSEARAIYVNNINNIGYLFFPGMTLTSVVFIDQQTDAQPKLNKVNSLDNAIGLLKERQWPAGINPTTSEDTSFVGMTRCL